MKRTTGVLFIVIGVLLSILFLALLPSVIPVVLAVFADINNLAFAIGFVTPVLILLGVILLFVPPRLQTDERKGSRRRRAHRIG